MAEEPELLTEIDGPIGRITFNRPHARNALTRNMLFLMTDFLKVCEQTPEVRCIVMTGAGEHFMAGGDVSGFAAAATMTADERQRDFESRPRNSAPVFAIMDRMNKPIIAKVRGACAGASVGWVAAADYVLCSDTGIFLVAHVNIGTSPDGGVSWYLPRVIGPRKAKEMAMLGNIIKADEALDLGLVNKVVPDADLDEATEKMAQRLANGPSVALGQIKRLMNRSLEVGLMDQLDAEAVSFGICGGSEDFMEGATAFKEKRKPVWKGR